MKQYRLTCAMAIMAVVLTASAACAQKARVTTHREMMTRLASLETADSMSGVGRMQMMTIGRSVQGKDIPIVVLSDPEVAPEATKRLFVICRQHGDEPAPTEAMLKLIEDLALARDDDTADLLTKVSFYIVPMVNPDGADKNQRRNARGADLNRDWLTLEQPEIRCVRAAIDSIAPEVLMDLHELSPGNNTTDFLEIPGPLSGASPEIVEASRDLQNVVIGLLRTHDLTVRYSEIEDKNPARLAHRYFPIHGGTLTLLLETRQAGTRQYQLQERTRTHLVGVMTVAKYLAGQQDDLKLRIAAHDEWRRSVQLASRKGKRQPAPAKK